MVGLGRMGANMTERLLRQDAELCLRGMGMSPLGPGEWLTSSGAPHLYVRVEVAETEIDARLEKTGVGITG